MFRLILLQMVYLNWLTALITVIWFQQFYIITTFKIMKKTLFLDVF